MPAYPDARTLENLGRTLMGHGYVFVCPTPATHKIVLDRPEGAHLGLRDIFGWNRPFAEHALEPDLFSLMREGELIEADGLRWRSRIRFSTVGTLLFAHSAYPTISEDDVFLGPDTYRFVSFIKRTLQKWSPRTGVPRVLDLGCGSGVGGIVAANTLTKDVELTLSDVNPRALIFSVANAGIADQKASIIRSDLFATLDGQFDLIVMNPPYLCDDKERLYRHGGSDYGTAIPIKMVKEAVDRLAPGGLLLAYTGAPIVRGEDRFWTGIQRVIPPGTSFVYEEIDPDIFGDELSLPAYAEVDRIAAVTLLVER